jgi:hypothetical protein
MKSDRQFLDHLTDEELFCILEATSLADVKNNHAHHKNIFPKEKLDLLETIAKKTPRHVKSASNKISESLIDALTPTSYLALLLDAGFTLITSIALGPFIAIGVGFLALFLLVGGVHFIGTYKEIKEKDQEENERFQFLALRNECANIYLRKKHQDEFLQEYSFKNVEAKPEEKKWQNAKGVLGAGVLVTGALFYTYYAVTQGLMIALAGSLVVGALGGPIGVGIALAVCIGVGIFFGYKKYQLHKKEQALQCERDGMKNEFEVKYKKCQKIRSKTVVQSLPISNNGDKIIRNAVMFNSRNREPERQGGLGPFLFQRPVELVSTSNNSPDPNSIDSPKFH